MTQAEEESRNRSAKVIKPGGPFLGMVVFHFLLDVCKLSNAVIHLFSVFLGKVVCSEVSGVGSLPSCSLQSPVAAFRHQPLFPPESMPVLPCSHIA